VELTIREDGIPLDEDEDPINSFQGRMSTLITPCEEATVEAYFLQGRHVEEAVKLPHQTIV
jgi:hypothetical protein